MAVTSRGIVTPNQTDEYKLVTDLNTMATSIDEALQDAANTYRGTSTQRTQFTSQAPEGTIWVDTNGEKIVWVKQGVSWVFLARANPTSAGMPFAMAAGTVVIPIDGNYGDANVTFPAGRFTVAPNVTWGRSQNGARSTEVAAVPGNITASSMTLGVYANQNYTGTVTVWWQAVQMTPSSAEG